MSITTDSDAVATATTDSVTTTELPVVQLRGAEVRGPRGTVFGPLTAESREPVTVVLGAHGTGRTSLLLALGGRMRLDAGSLRVLGLDSFGTRGPATGGEAPQNERVSQHEPHSRARWGRRSQHSPSELRELRRATGIAGFAGLDELEPAVSVGATIRERLSWASPWYRPAPRVTDELARSVLAPTFGDVAIPARRELVRELTQAQDLLLRIALARIEHPELLLIDNLDTISDPAERSAVAGRLRALAVRGLPSVVATADERDLTLFGAPGAAGAAIHLGG